MQAALYNHVHTQPLSISIFSGIVALEVTLKSNYPAVLGSNITFEATVLGYDGENLKFVYRDDAKPQHNAEVR